jgi:hypothetical protein
MRCPACDVENAAGATVCTSCGKNMTQPAGAAPAQVFAAPPAKGRRLSRLAVFALLAAALAPSLQVLRDQAGGPLFAHLAIKTHFFATKGYLFLMVLDTGATVLFVAAAIAAVVALAQVLIRSDLRGGALAVGGLLLAVGGMAAGTYATFMPGQAGILIRAFGSGGDSYVWQTTVIVLAAAVVCEIVLAFVRPRPAAPPA